MQAEKYVHGGGERLKHSSLKIPQMSFSFRFFLLILWEFKHDGDIVEALDFGYPKLLPE